MNESDCHVSLGGSSGRLYHDSDSRYYLTLAPCYESVNVSIDYPVCFASHLSRFIGYFIYVKGEMFRDKITNKLVKIYVTDITLHLNADNENEVDVPKPVSIKSLNGAWGPDFLGDVSSVEWIRWLRDSNE